ncbi:response regulator [Pseudobacteroides cellulosolvens]|uniref:Stage 0 sporulation protein A homolog n=1 Tax=Pseudobacteroides cellulosolvens ATCC 35603 = DSM 2933 TaxID=398512 RepID=A0A0L6JM61_9FIRM|nr:response regulator transcription factor [Pseudobacteroides cellulosolvens]KNY26886.1 response regulator receiver protein [Pseudobacteroides cellulosolvens ATCC 35603 = DSM 2933]
MDQIRIIIVEDDTDWMKTITKFLSNEDDFLIVGTATSKADSVKLAKSIDFDIILMDINLSGDNYDGINAAQEILEFSNRKILMLTCISDIDVIKNSFTAGAVNYITKDNYRELPGIIRNCLNDNSPLNVMLQEYARLKEQ